MNAHYRGNSIMDVDSVAEDRSNSKEKRTTRTIKIEKVLQATPPAKFDTITLQLTDEDTVCTLWDRLADEGFRPPLRIEDDAGHSYNKGSGNTIIHPFESFTVVDGTPGENEISIDQRFIEYSNQRYGKPIQFNIGEAEDHESKNPIKSITDGRGFQASFQRTPRMPDDNKLHQLPGSLGAYDLFSVEAYADRLPDKIIAEGGVFLPMWQREALWIDFDSSRMNSFGGPSQKYAVRVFVGKINAVSGLKMGEEPPEGEEQKQDYIVLPGQEWLDGICVEPGVVRQFVAMPLGSGYTIEGQKTKEEKHGGLQIEVIPELVTALRWWTRDNLVADSVPDIVNHKVRLDELKSPRELGLQIGDVIRCYPLPVCENRPITIKELCEQNPSAIWKANYWASSRMYEEKTMTMPSVLSLRNMVDCSYGQDRSYAEASELPKYKTSPQVMIQSPIPQVPQVVVESQKGSSGSPDVGERVDEGYMSHIGGERHGIAAMPELTDLVSAKSPSFKDYSYTTEETSEKWLSLGLQSHHQPTPLDDVDIKSASFFEDESGSSDPFTSQRHHHPTRLDDVISEPDDTLENKIEALSIKPEDTPTPTPKPTTKDLKAMGLAAGGKLVQDIYKDPYPLNIWNHASARIINIHILDPASCERVTHIVPQPPTLDAKAYAEAGGEFYVVEEQTESRVEGGDFGDIKSVSAMDKAKLEERMGKEEGEDEFNPLEPRICKNCDVRLCDCVIRPCNHTLCNICLTSLYTPQPGKCPLCGPNVQHDDTEVYVAGFSAPMNIPGEEPVRTKVPVNVLRVEDGRVVFKSVSRTRI